MDGVQSNILFMSNPIILNIRMVQEVRVWNTHRVFNRTPFVNSKLIVSNLHRNNFYGFPCPCYFSEAVRSWRRLMHWQLRRFPAGNDCETSNERANLRLMLISLINICKFIQIFVKISYLSFQEKKWNCHLPSIKARLGPKNMYFTHCLISRSPKSTDFHLDFYL